MSAAEFSWTNPTQVIDPTHTQVRMLNSVSLWATIGYPATGIVWGGLDPANAYEFQVRLIRVVDGIVTHFSPSRSYNFSTPAATVPVVDVDENGDGDVTFPTPGAGCTLEWELQESDDGTTWTAIDDGTDSAPPWTIDIDFGALDAEKLYRVRSREMCPGAGAWVYSDTFGAVCTTPPAVAVAPFDDAIGYLPGLCPPDIIVETVSDTTAIHAPSWGTVEVDGDGNIVLVSSTQGPVVFNVNTTATDNLTGDASLNIRVNLSTQPVGEVGLLQWAGLTVAVVPEGAGFKMRGKAHEEGAGVTSVTDAAELDLNAWHDLTITHDVAAGDLLLYADGVEVASSLGSVGERHDSGLYVLENAAASRSTNAAIWDRVLDPTEIPGYVAPVTVTINQKSGQADPAASSPILFTIVFDGAVSGFTSADVTLSGTAGGTLGKSISGSGPTYELSVTGMTTAGTVIATIGAAVCTSVATGAPNSASTSTDNTVTWNAGDYGSGHTGIAAWVAANSSLVVEYWKMNDAAGSTETSDIASGRNLTYAGGYSSGTIDGQAAVDFNGTTGFAFINDDAAWDSIHAIFMVVEFDNNAGGAWHTLIDRDQGGTRLWQFRRNDTGKLEYQRTGPTVGTFAGTTTLSASTRYTVGVGYDGQMKLYVNGALDATHATIGDFGAGSSLINIGRNSNGAGSQYVNGRIASVVLLGTIPGGAGVLDAIMAGLHASWA